MARMNNVAYSRSEQQFYTLFEEAIKKCNLYDKQVLLSFVTEAQFKDLPAFYSYNKHTYKGQRFFWSEPGRELSYVGLGEACKIELNEQVENRYLNVHHKWQSMMEDAYVTANSPSYTGPLLFGGYSFDQDGEKTEVWSDYAHTSFVVPKYMLTVTKGKAWLTVNTLIDKRTNWTPEMYYFDFNKCTLLNPLISEQDDDLLIEEIRPSDFMDAVKKATDAINSGELEKVVLARPLRLEHHQSIDTVKALRHLLVDQQNTYVFAIERGESCFLGATPERLIRRQGTELLTLSLAGSIARGTNPIEDHDLSSFLAKDGKNLHEHMLAVHMIKGEMQRLCETVDAPDGPIIMKLKDLQHLATPISGHAKSTATLLNAVEALHPTPALGGMPRHKAIEKIKELEYMDRGWYAAPIGYLNKEMDGEFVVAIRSGVVKGNIAYLFAGCGVVGDSDPVSEYHETKLKFRPMLAALQALKQKA